MFANVFCQSTLLLLCFIKAFYTTNTDKFLAGGAATIRKYYRKYIINKTLHVFVEVWGSSRCFPLGMRTSMNICNYLQPLTSLPCQFFTQSSQSFKVDPRGINSLLQPVCAHIILILVFVLQETFDRDRWTENSVFPSSEKYLSELFEASVCVVNHEIKILHFPPLQRWLWPAPFLSATCLRFPTTVWEFHIVLIRLSLIERNYQVWELTWQTCQSITD